MFVGQPGSQHKFLVKRRNSVWQGHIFIHSTKYIEHQLYPKDSSTCWDTCRSFLKKPKSLHSRRLYSRGRKQTVNKWTYVSGGAKCCERKGSWMREPESERGAILDRITREAADKGQFEQRPEEVRDWTCGYQRKRVQRQRMKVDCHGWLWWRLEVTGVKGSYWSQYGYCEENIMLLRARLGQSWLLFQANAGDHSRLWARETVVALFYILANILTKFLMMENANLQEWFPHYLKAKHLFTLPGLLQDLALTHWLWEGTGQEYSSWEPTKADNSLPATPSPRPHPNPSLLYNRRAQAGKRCMPLIHEHPLQQWHS